MPMIAVWTQLKTFEYEFISIADLLSVEHRVQHLTFIHFHYQLKNPFFYPWVKSTSLNQDFENIFQSTPPHSVEHNPYILFSPNSFSLVPNLNRIMIKNHKSSDTGRPTQRNINFQSTLAVTSEQPLIHALPPSNIHTGEMWFGWRFISCFSQRNL